MASRSFKPASYLASAAQQKPGRSSRPTFVRTSSSSSTHSNKGDDSFLASFRSLNTGIDGGKEGDWTSAGSGNVSCSGTSPHCRTPSSASPGSLSTQKVEETPSRKRSKPIAIELPGRSSPSSYTPLTARGDLIGGYFPDFEDIHHKSYRPHPFAPHNISGASTPGSPSNMSASSSHSSPGSEVTPRGPASVLTPLLNSSPTFPIIDALGIPLGKYYPSNYKSTATTTASFPQVTAAPLPPTNLTIPSTSKAKTKKKPGHERDSSDVKRKLQQYQRDMIAQARIATSQGGPELMMPEPISPRLLPTGSPGPITPFELEEEQGYLIAGTRGRGSSLIGNGLEKEKHMVERMITTEQGRAVHVESSGR